jgi:drug/metabolite transporter (DMT)-like permease
LNTRLKAHLAVLAANLIFAASFSIVKVISPWFIQPLALNVARVGVSVTMFWILYLLKPSSAGIQKKHIVRFIICAASGVALNQVLFIKGVTLTTSIHAVLLMLASPIFLTFIAAWLLKEALGWRKIAGLVLGISGAAFLVLMKESSGHASNALLGDLLVLINAICYAFYLVLVRPLMKEYSPVHVIRWVFTFGTFMILPVGFVEFMQVDWSSFTSTAWISLAFVVIGSTFFAYLFNVYGVQHLGPSITGTYIYTQPVFAAIIAVFFFGEEFTIEKVLAAVLIFAGVYLVNMKSSQLEE